MASEIDPVSRADMNPQLGHAVADGLAIAKITRLDPPQTQANPGFGGPVAQGREPIGKWLAAVLTLISQELHQRVE